MINYGYILKCKEKDNPSSFLRATYLLSNIGDLIKCYGRSVRFPQDAILYEAEMKLAIGDIIMQCEMLREEHNIKQFNIQITETDLTKEDEIKWMTYHAAELMCNILPKNQIIKILMGCYMLCYKYNWNFDEVQHLGFLHVCERLEQFEKEGWR